MACENIMADFIAPFVKNSASKIQLMYLVTSLCPDPLDELTTRSFRICISEKAIKTSATFFGLCDLPTPCCCLLQEHKLNSHSGLSQLQLHIPRTRCRLTLDLVILYTPLKNTSKHTCSYALNLKPPAPLYPLQDFKALYKYCIIIIMT